MTHGLAVESRRTGVGDLKPLLVRLGRRLRVRDGWLAAQRSLWIAVAAAVVGQVVGRLWPIAHLALWTVAPLALWLPLVIGYALVRPSSAMRVARRCDIELGLKERLSTATALQNSASLGFQRDLVVSQRADTLAVVRSIDPRSAFPLRWLPRPLIGAGLLAAAVLLLSLLPNPMDAILAERAEVARVAEEQAERVEELRDALAASELSEEEREELLRQLAELAERLRANAGDRESALADLARLEETLQERVDPRADLKQSALDALAAQIEALAGQESGESADPSAMDETLEALAEQLAQATDAERQELAQRLSQMAARAGQAGNASVAQALSALAQAAQSGDLTSARQAAAEAARAMRHAQGELSTQDALRRSLSQLQQSREALAQAGEGQGQAGGQSQASNSGQGNAGGQAQGTAGQGGQSGQGQGGQGTKADQLPPGTGQGAAQRPQGEARPGGQGALDQQIFVPWERRPGSGDELTLPGRDSGEGDSEVRERENPLPGTARNALVPYYEVYAQYLDAASQAMERTYVPEGLRDYVRAYFSQLEPD